MKITLVDNLIPLVTQLRTPFVVQKLRKTDTCHFRFSEWQPPETGIGLPGNDNKLANRGNSDNKPDSESILQCNPRNTPKACSKLVLEYNNTVLRGNMEAYGV
ncbi:hypothetical protein TNIN_314101 [Trichonephila inaurata madagascariensis]|uniref:Uncharacterized protein n=1 Tax=Trichonephila inaurata madagascariensis TaxID=2747483 RepID=A0A8X6YTL8_9ARAC|nr:hypothetical protein TNIN_299311 [Trichonephila inaurata madagascariensis]GFY76247.1 hypothetical protein TNIN_314101 [Trichonephila inaurata madagascariensis]